MDQIKIGVLFFMSGHYVQ